MPTRPTCTVACIQLTPDHDRERGVREAVDGIRRAAAEGAQLVVLPEHATLLHASGRVMRETAQPADGGAVLAAFREAGRESGCWVIVGSIAVATDEDRMANRCFVIAADGNVVARYDKIHMFDATLPSGRLIRESSTYRPGDEAVVVDTPLGRVGLSICYDVRFPALYRALAQAGADVLVVPSAFTAATGRLHWHTLLRARAIETGCYVLAAATCGAHPGGHRTYGHSLIVDPTGTVVADGGDGPTVMVANIDPEAAGSARAMIPSLHGDRAFGLRRVVVDTPSP
jgi:predicted amidohydrolase